MLPADSESDSDFLLAISLSVADPAAARELVGGNSDGDGALVLPLAEKDASAASVVATEERTAMAPLALRVQCPTPPHSDLAPVEPLHVPTFDAHASGLMSAPLCIAVDPPPPTLPLPATAIAFNPEPPADRPAAAVALGAGADASTREGVAPAAAGNVAVDAAALASTAAAPPQVTLVLHAGLELRRAHERLIESLFAGCSRVVIAPLSERGVLSSGTLLLRTEGYDAHGRRQDPTITKIEAAAEAAREAERTQSHSQMLGSEHTLQLLRGPLYVDARGVALSAAGALAAGKDETDSVGGAALGGDPVGGALGAIVFELAGACWVLPNFNADGGSGPLFCNHLFYTFHDHLSKLLSSGASAPADDATSVVRNLWGPGGPLCTLAMRTATRDERPADDARHGWVRRSLASVASLCADAFVPRAPVHEDLARAASYTPSATLLGCLRELTTDGILPAEEPTGGMGRQQRFVNSLVLATVCNVSRANTSASASSSQAAAPAVPFMPSSPAISTACVGGESKTPRGAATPRSGSRGSSNQPSSWVLEELESLDVSPLVELMRFLHSCLQSNRPDAGGAPNGSAEMPPSPVAHPSLLLPPPPSPTSPSVLQKWEKEMRSIYAPMSHVPMSELDSVQRDKVERFQAATGCEAVVAMTLLRSLLWDFDLALRHALRHSSSPDGEPFPTQLEVPKAACATPRGAERGHGCDKSAQATPRGGRQSAAGVPGGLTPRDIGRASSRPVAASGNGSLAAVATQRGGSGGPAQRGSQPALSSPFHSSSTPSSTSAHGFKAHAVGDHSTQRPWAPPWLSKWRPLQTHQHANLHAANVILDVHGSLWLLEAPAERAGNPFDDAAALISSIFVETLPLPLTLEEARALDPASLSLVFGLSRQAAARWHAALVRCTHVSDLCQTLAADTELSPSLRRVAEREEVHERLREALVIADAFLAPVSGLPPELSQMGTREPPASWPAHAQLALRLASTIVKQASALVSRCVESERAASRGVPKATVVEADTHSCHFLMPLLERTLASMHFVNLSVAQKRLAWWIARRCAVSIRASLARPPPRLITRAEGVAGPAHGLQLASGQPLLMLLDADGRLRGGEGQTQFAVTHLDGVDLDLESRPERSLLDAPTSELLVATGAGPRCSFDNCSQRVLPWRPMPADRTAGLGNWAPGTVSKGQPHAPTSRLAAVIKHAKGDGAALRTMRGLTSLLPGPPTGVLTGTESTIDHRELDASVERIVEQMRSQQHKVSSAWLRELLDRALEQVHQARHRTKEARSEFMKLPQRMRTACGKQLIEGTYRDQMRSILAVFDTSSTSVAPSLSSGAAYLEAALASPLCALEAECAAELADSGAIGLRRYETGAALVVYHGGEWKDADVLQPPGEAELCTFNWVHKLQLCRSGREVSLSLTPFNATPREMGCATFETLRQRWEHSLRTQHSSIVDALSGRRLDVFAQCVPIACAILGGSSPTLKGSVPAAAPAASAPTGSGPAIRERVMVAFANCPHVATTSTQPFPAPHACTETCRRRLEEIGVHPIEKRTRWRWVRHTWPSNLEPGVWELLGESAAAAEDDSGNCSRAAGATSTKAGTTNKNDGQERGEPNRNDAGELGPGLGPGLAAAVEEDGVDDVVSLAASSDVAALGAWLHRAYTRRLAQPGARDDAGRERSSVLLTGPPAAGKTCLTSQLVMHMLQRPDSLIPVPIKVQQLQRRLLMEEHRSVFGRMWNWVDAYLLITHGAGSERYLFLRQALMARRALVILDGIDEGGRARREIERHVTEVLAPQGHVMLVTSRPAGFNWSIFERGFHAMVLRPLSDHQQRQVIEQRIGDRARAEELWQYVCERVLVDDETGERTTGNPLMLSMIISAYEARHAPHAAQAPPSLENGSSAVRTAMPPLAAMPATIAELYQTASSAMLSRVDLRERGAAASAAAIAQLTALLEATAFQAHAAERRIITEEHLLSAAVGLASPERLAAITRPSYDGGAQVGHYVQVLRGAHGGAYGLILNEDATELPFNVLIDLPGGGTRSAWIARDDVQSTGLWGKEAFERQYGASARSAALHCAVAELPEAMQDALRAVRERCMQDRLPLVSLLQADPFEMQFSHLSFQEFFAARATCARTYRLPPSAAEPWRWPVWWANTLRLGAEMGADFASGMLEGSRVVNGRLNLHGAIGGHRPTAMRAVVELCCVAPSVALGQNSLTREEVRAMAMALQRNMLLRQLDLSKNALKDEGGAVVLQALSTGGAPALESLRLVACGLGSQSARGLATCVRACTKLAGLELQMNGLTSYGRDYDGVLALAAALGESTSVTFVDLRFNALDQRCFEALGRAGQLSTAGGQEQVVGLDENFRPIVTTIDELTDAVSTLPQCPVCLLKISGLILHPCRHSICKKCLDGWMARSTSSMPPCPMCRAPISGWHECEAGERGAGDALLDESAGRGAGLRVVV